MSSRFLFVVIVVIIVAAIVANVVIHSNAMQGETCTHGTDGTNGIGLPRGACVMMASCAKGFTDKGELGILWNIRTPPTGFDFGRGEQRLWKFTEVLDWVHPRNCCVE